MRRPTGKGQRVMGSKTMAAGLALLAAAALVATAARAAVPTPVPAPQRGKISAERLGQHDAANIRTRFYNWGMVGDYPSNPGDANLALFHSAEVPKGSGMNYTDGITPFVLARITDRFGGTQYHMETGFRERQERSPFEERQLRFEPRPGYFNDDPRTNSANSPAISSDSRTWPSFWPDKLDSGDDPGWSGAWNGYFGKRPAADQESFTVMDDDAYFTLPYIPDTRDSTRHGLGLRVEVRGFQWSNPQAGNVIFWHYDITNESTTDYNDNIVFGLYMDSGVGGSEYSCDNVYESDDDNCFWDRNAGLNLVYTWDKRGRGVDLLGCERTGYLGYAYLETPGNEYDGLDNDGDGLRNESRVNGPGTPFVGADAIRAAFHDGRYDTTKFVASYGALDLRPAFIAGIWYPGDEDMDWDPQFDDVGADGLEDTHDTGEGDGAPTQGEPNFGRTDLNESDQIGLTGFKLNRIKADPNNVDRTVDGIVFYEDGQHWPERLYNKFSDPNPAARFDSALVENYNIAFLFASGPFRLPAGATERFSLALAYGADLSELRTNVRTVQQIYDANYQFAVAPHLPTLTAEPGDGFVKLSWNDVAERSVDPVTHKRDFEGYKIYRSTDPDFRDVKVLTTGQGNPSTLPGRPLVQFDLADSLRGYYTRRTVEGVGFWMGDDTGIPHTWTDTDVVNGQRYFYAITSYDYGSTPEVPESKVYFPSENSFFTTGTPRGGFLYPSNVVEVRPNRRAPGFTRASAGSLEKFSGKGTGNVRVEVVGTDSVPDGHEFVLRFHAPAPDSVRAGRYVLVDTTVAGGRTLLDNGADFDSAGVGVAGGGLLPVVYTQAVPTVDSASVKLRTGGTSDARFRVTYQPGRSANRRRPGYPEDFYVVFDDAVRDTGLQLSPVLRHVSRFLVYVKTDSGPRQVDIRFQDLNNNGYLDQSSEYFDLVLPFKGATPSQFDATWRVDFDPRFPVPAVRPHAGDTLDVKLVLPLGDNDMYRFTTKGQYVDRTLAQDQWGERPYVVPNPYVGAASFEPQRTATAGRGDRRIEFRSVPLGSTIRIYTVRGGLVRTLHQDGTSAGFVAWDLRNEDNLDVAPGLYLFHVDAPGLGTHVGKFAVIK